ncbi:YqjK-like family protein [Rhodoferax sp.]|uniref:YqjK-like family protein n=1 Tax=Rhodoferax sp. TaxID=50421 RepID=UPI0025ED6F50|nr:YqjK-like family protein [Rhodoferax sp.]
MTSAELLLKQQRLLIRSTELRLQLGADLQRLQRPAAWVDQAKAGLNWLYQNPQWPAGVLALLLILKPGRALAWGGRLFWLWKSLPRLRRWRNTVMGYLAQR